MQNPSTIPFQIIDWESIPATEHHGDSGVAYWRTLEFQGLRLRVVTYSKGFMANHWCEKGHIVYCLEGEFVSEMEDGRSFSMVKGTSYIVSDGQSSHRSQTREGVTLLIIDGDFLKSQPTS